MSPFPVALHPPRRIIGCLAFALLAGGARADDAADVQRLLRGSQPQAALERAERAVADRPQDPQLAFLRGVALMDLGRDDAAIGAFARVAELAPELPEPHNNLALLHARAGRWDAALAALQAALRNDPTHAAARRNLGDVHLQLAIRAWESAAAAAPGDAALARRLQAARELASQPR